YGAPVVEPPRVTSPLMALVPSVVPSAPTPGAVVAAAPPPAVLAAATQPGPSLVLSIANPQPNDLLPRGRYVMQGQAFDRAAASGSGVDRVSVFLDDRDSGGQHLADGTLGQPTATAFTVTADFSRLSGAHNLFVYARSS